MKCKLLPQRWRAANCPFYACVLLLFLSSALHANDPLLSNTIGNDLDVIKISNAISTSLPQSTITGTVVDENGIGLPGASVVEKGTTNGTQTDFDGNFTINVSRNATLAISYIGFVSKEVVVGSSTKINIVLQEDAASLDEVVVIGYGTQTRAEVTNAVSQLAGPVLKQTPAISTSNALQGQVPGLFVVQGGSAPGFDDSQLRVRGSSTFNGNVPVLIVIDGVANRDPDGLNRIDGGDIESISVLKDASAAIYGAQAAGGVILVTTKRGKTGKAKFQYTTDQGFSRPIGKLGVANALQFMRINNTADELDGRPLGFPQELIDNFQNGTRESTDWWDDIIGGRSLSQSRHSLNVSGGSERVRYFTSFGHARQGALAVNDDKTQLRQYNLRTNLDIDVTDNFKVQFDVSGRRKYTQRPQGDTGGVGNQLAVTSPLLPAFINGDSNFPASGYSEFNPAARVTSPGYGKFNNDVFNANLNWDLKMPWLTDGISFKGFVSYDHAYWVEKEFNFTWNWYELDQNGEPVQRNSRTIEPPGLTQTFRQSNQTTVNFRLEYEKRFGKDHDLKAFVAYEQNEGAGNFFQAGRLNFESAAIDELFAGSLNQDNWKTDGSASETSRQNYFGRLSYSAFSKYLFQFNFRYDGSSIFPKGNRFGFFPGASAGWRLSEESFTPEVFSDLKLRASWGILGNDRVSPFQYLQAFSFPSGLSGNSGGYVIGGEDVQTLVPGVSPNANITWEKTESIDIGLEGSLFDGKLGFAFDYFKQNTTDILAARNSSIPNVFGILPPSENIGEFFNEGVDAQVTYNYDNRNGFNFGITGNLTYARNRIEFFDEVPPAEGSEFQKLEGKPLNSQLVYKYIGIYRSQEDLDNNINYPGAGLGNLIFADLNGDGTINGDDRYRYDAKAFPELQYGLNLVANYKNFDMSMLLQGQGRVKKTVNNEFNASGGGNNLAYFVDRTYSLSNTDAEFPRIRRTGLDGGVSSDFWYRNADFLRLKQMSIGYSLPDKTLEKLKSLESFRLYVSATNILTIFDALGEYERGDPEFTNNFNFPQLSTINLGLNVGF
ncbi:TonB-linked outer membrane protein, SusC/RagA family [Arenibacter palladensis]|uniref:TonB-linked outer membrane protein, SusC/RagA family n=1 Tax=Arenibacter palladensis TaxID=237373 RepID=A0A1M4STZ2_9FLAO|nr:TonB-dependent receptor [Arenibacter palladensis]SHE35710.1 TonB-linked outer membrane protein, SusC/RagA family [Arenibacter palladensis]